VAEVPGGYDQAGRPHQAEQGSVVGGAGAQPSEADLAQIQKLFGKS